MSGSAEAAPRRSDPFPAPARPRPWWLGCGRGCVGPRLALRRPLPSPGRDLRRRRARLFPAVIGAGLVLLGILLLVAVARGERFEPQEAEDADLGRPPSRASFWMTVAAGVAPILVIRPSAFRLAAALAFALTARAFGSRRLLLDLAVGAVLGVSCWLLFSRLLGLSPPGFPPLGVN